MPDHELSDLPEQIADAVVQRLAPSLAQHLARYQERMLRAWLTPPTAARLAGCRDQIVYEALHDRSLVGVFNKLANGGRGAWHIRRIAFDAWVVSLHLASLHLASRSSSNPTVPNEYPHPE